MDQDKKIFTKSILHSEDSHSGTAHWYIYFHTHTMRTSGKSRLVKTGPLPMAASPLRSLLLDADSDPTVSTQQQWRHFCCRRRP